MIPRLAALVAAAAAAACALHAPPPAPAPITTAELAGHVRFLASDALEGRGVGTRGDELARGYIAAQFESCGLRPGMPDGTWHQPVPILGIRSEVKAPLVARGKNGEATFAAPGDFTAVAGNADAMASFQGAELVFVGYGISAPEQQWDDFGAVDVKGKVLLLLNDDPNDDPARFGGKGRTFYGRWTYKYEEAARRGALGAIVIHTTESAGYPFQVVQANQGRENCWLPFRKDEPTLAIRSWLTEDAARKVCALGGHDLDALRKRSMAGSQPPVPLGVTLDLAIANTTRQLRSANVVGVLPGRDGDHRGEYVVVSAHFDHLGLGTPRRGDPVYHGAVDNASGVAGMLALARWCSQQRERPARSILFVALTAEESGLLGAQYFTTNPTVPASRLVADFNIDCLNVFGRTRDVEYVGYGRNSLTALASALAEARGRTVVPESRPDLGSFYRSDHFHFARIGVPTLYFGGGRDFLDRPDERKLLKASYTTTHYHQPTDQLATWWNLDGAIDDLELLRDCLLATAEAPAPPTWTAGDEFAGRR